MVLHHMAVKTAEEWHRVMVWCWLVHQHLLRIALAADTSMNGSKSWESTTNKTTETIHYTIQYIQQKHRPVIEHRISPAFIPSDTARRLFPVQFTITGAKKYSTRKVPKTTRQTYSESWKIAHQATHTKNEKYIEMKYVRTRETTELGYFKKASTGKNYQKYTL